MQRLFGLCALLVALLGQLPLQCVESAAQHVPACHVPHGVANE